MKKLFLLLIFAIMPICMFASPFGLKMGMTLDEITEVCNGVKPKYVENDGYYIYPAKKHPLFKQYIAFVDKEKGLYCIRAITDEIQTNNYGTEIKNAFSEIEERISKTYGRSKLIDELDSNTIWKDDNYWVQALKDGARKYGAIWESTSKNKLNDDLDMVLIYANAQTFPQVGWIILEYDFSNMQAVKDSQDDVF